MNVYSGLGRIPGGKASEKLIEGCLVLEGGAFRGLYTQGFLDAMMENDLNLSAVIGVSAGALGGANYVSGQIGRSARINLAYRHDGRYVGARALVKSGSILDVSFLTEDRGIFEPLDTEGFYRPERRFVAVATNCLTGKPTYFEKGKCGDILKATRASGTMPYISPPVKIDGVPYLDGGCSCKIPYRWAIGQRYEKIVVIRTRGAFFRQPNTRSSLPFRFYKKYPAFAEVLSRDNIDYNRQCAEVNSLGRKGRLLCFCPSREMKIDPIERDMEKLGKLYWLGYRDCSENLDRLKEYLFS